MNINFENDTRHEISNKSLKRLESVMHSQDDFGIEKYGKPLNSRMNYNWLSMAREEIADFLKYLECEEERKEVVVSLMEHAFKYEENWKFYITKALDLMKKGGTGK
jgi:hypothetical protein